MSAGRVGSFLVSGLSTGPEARDPGPWNVSALRGQSEREAGGWSLAGGTDPEPLRGLTAGLDSKGFLSCSTAHCLQGT